MLCRPISCAHGGCSDYTATYASPSRKTTKLWCRSPRYNSRLPFQIRGRGRRQAFKDQVAAHAIQETQDWAPEGLSEQCQLPLLPVILIDQVLSCSAADLWQVVCEPDPNFQSTIHRLAGNNDIQHSNWHQQGGRLVREEQYIKSLRKNSIGPTEALCIDEQQCIHQSNAGFAVERKVYTPKVPFGGSFYNLVHWCAWTEGDPSKVRLQVSCDVVYTNKWVPAKSIITSSSTEGMKEYYNMWLQELYDHLKFPDTPRKSADAVPPTIRTSRADLQIEP